MADCDVLLSHLGALHIVSVKSMRFDTLPIISHNAGHVRRTIVFPNLTKLFTSHILFRCEIQQSGYKTSISFSIYFESTDLNKFKLSFFICG